MFTTEDITTMRTLLSEAFPDIEETKREEMLNTLINKHANAVPFCTMNGMHIARIGVKYPLGEDARGRFYYVTEYDNELLDL